MRVLIVTSSLTGAESISGELIDSLVEHLKRAVGNVTIRVRDLGNGNVPHLTDATQIAIRGTPDSAEQSATRSLSDTLIEEVRAADLVVIGSPMINFGISSVLKAWFDHLIRAGTTFRYTSAGPEGLIHGTRAIVVMTRGGVYSSGSAVTMDAQEPHLKTMLDFIGIKDVKIIRAERLASAEFREASIGKARRELETIADEISVSSALSRLTQVGR